MDRLRIALLSLLVAPAAFAQLSPPVRPRAVVSNSAMVIEDRGAKIEVLPNERATTAVDAASGRTVHRLQRAAATAPMNDERLGVVFNYTMQQQGYATGEIAFMMRPGATPDTGSGNFPGLKRLTASGLYIVRATTPAQLVSLTKELQSNHRVAWVEPIVVYASSEPAPSDGR